MSFKIGKHFIVPQNVYLPLLKIFIFSLKPFGNGNDELENAWFVLNCAINLRNNSWPTFQNVVLRPFFRTGFGPIFIKSSNLRRAPITKAYICLFVCMSTNVLHLKLVNGHSTNEFIAALKRFISRRGNPSQIFSDNIGCFEPTERSLSFLPTKRNSKYQGISRVKWNSSLFLQGLQIQLNFVVKSAVKNTNYHHKRWIGESPILNQVKWYWDARWKPHLDISSLT